MGQSRVEAEREENYDYDHDPTTSAELPPRDVFYQSPELKLDQVALTSACLALVFALSLVCAWHYEFYQLPMYMAGLCLFHFLEFYITARYNPTRVTQDSFLLNNGTAYTIAQVASVAEAAIEHVLYPRSKALTALSTLGLCIAVMGQLCRSLAMIHAANSFNHVIQRNKNHDHQLVTSGIYRFSRHPSYFGFFYWSLGLQVFLLNPVSFIGFAVVLWRFFNSRIQDEEKHLVRFFGDDYVAFRSRVSTKIPFIR